MPPKRKIEEVVSEKKGVSDSSKIAKVSAPSSEVTKKSSKPVSIEQQMGKNSSKGKNKTAKIQEKSTSLPKTAAKEASNGSSSSRKEPKTFKEKIVHLLANQEKLIGLATVKRILFDNYGFEETKANGTKITKSLKELEDEGHPEFGRIERSYHGGVNSPAYQHYTANEERKNEQQNQIYQNGDYLQCPFCETWNEEKTAWKDEDSIARGSKYLCRSCKKYFYTWIGDWDNKVGHTVEYKYQHLER